MAAVNQNEDALEFASEDLMRDGGIVMAEVKHFRCALHFASEDLRRYKGILVAEVEKAHRQV